MKHKVTFMRTLKQELSVTVSAKSKLDAEIKAKDALCECGDAVAEGQIEESDEVVTNIEEVK